MPVFSPSPTVGQVVASLNRSTPPSSVQARLAGLHPLSAILALLLLVLLAAFLVLSWRLVRHVEGLVGDIREHRTRHAANVRMPVPSDDLLLDGKRFAAAVAASPQRAALLHLQRARLLVRHADDAGATLGFAQAQRLDPRLITIDDRLEWARILIQHGERERALALLRRTDGTALDDVRRQRLSALLLDLLVATRQQDPLVVGPGLVR